MYTTINLLDIYQLKNNVVSEKFHFRASRVHNYETKRLYTSVRRSQLQRLTASGFGTLSLDEKVSLHENFWDMDEYVIHVTLTFRSKLQNSKINIILGEKPSFEFPLCFSPFCTLEGDKENFIDKITTGFFFLVECLVFFEKVLILISIHLLVQTLEVEDQEELRTLDSTGYDSVYVRSTQEFWLLNPDNILPVRELDCNANRNF